MTFSRIDLLPLNDSEERQKARDRWEDDKGRELSDKIVDLIRAGAGEDFLQYDFEAGNLGFLKDQWDLAGFQLVGEDIEFPRGDNFENINFSNAEFWHTTFTKACFPQTRFAFTRLYNVTFRNCIFALAHFYGSHIEKCKFENCDFVEGNGFVNCDMIDTTFTNCFFYKNIFKHCRFNENVDIINNNKILTFGLLPRAIQFKQDLDLDKISSIYQGIKDGFLAGEIFNQARVYLFLQRQAYTRFNAKRKMGEFLWEFIAGYGLKPGRVLIVLGLMFGGASCFFSWRLGTWSDGLLLSAGAFLTFGAKADLLGKLSFVNHLIYIGSAFSGVSLVALFVTVLASVLLKDR